MEHRNDPPIPGWKPVTWGDVEAGSDGIVRKREKPPFPSRTEQKDIVYLKMASAMSELSKDPSTKVGAIIVSREGRIVSAGYNGFPSTVDDHPDWYADRDTKYPLVIHAEENAVLYGDRRDLVGATIYCTHPPCGECAKSIAASFIKRIVVISNDEERFSPKRSELVRTRANIQFTEYPKESIT